MSVRAFSLALAVVALAASITAALAPGRAHAYPFLPPRQVPNAIAGPADPHVGSMIINPAAIGALPRFHLWIDGDARVQLGRIVRDPVDGGVGINPGQVDIATANPDAFVGATFAVRDYFTIGVAVHTPLTDFTRYGESPARYHAVDHTLAVLAQTLAAGIRISRRFYVGAAVHFSESWLRYHFDRDAALDGGSALVDQPNALCGGQPCGLENPLARQRLGLRGFGYAIGWSLGLLVRPIDRLSIGLAWTRPSGFFPRDHNHVVLTDRRATRVGNVPGELTLLSPEMRCPDLPGSPATCTGNDEIAYLIPDSVQLAMRVEVSPRFEIEGGARWVGYGVRRALDVTLQGPELQRAGATTATRPPPQFLLDRGLKDTWALWMSGRFRVRDKLRLMPFAFFETSAVRREVVNPASIDSEKLDVTLVAEWRPTRMVTIGASIGWTSYFLGQAGGGFLPRAQVACVDARYSLDACVDSLAGRALPEASGRYTLFVLHAGAAIGLDF